MSWPSPCAGSSRGADTISSTATITALAVALAWINPTQAIAAEPAASDASVDPFSDDEPTDTPDAGPTIQETSGTEDEVVLANGGFVRGRISELSPGERVVIVPSGGGDSREIAWSDIAVVRRGTGTAAPAQPPAQPAVQPETQPAAEPEPFIGTALALVPIDIEVENDKTVTLYEVTGEAVAVGYGVAASAISFRAVCESPCRKALAINPATSYFVGGPGLSDSGGFSIRDRDHVTLKVHAGSNALRGGGWAMIIGGAVAVVTGVVLVITPSLGEFDGNVDRNLKVGGGLSIGGGLALMGGGVPMVHFGRTTVRVFSRGGTGSR